ncbi:uncharacterized protein ACOB8E_011222 isoform 2-T2 [Sarcophilus harrisii]
MIWIISHQGALRRNSPSGRRTKREHNYASCYRKKRAMQMLGRGSYFSLFANPPCLAGPRKPLACPAPKMTLRQISRLIRALKQVRLRDSRTSKDTPLPEALSRSRSDSLQTAPTHAKSAKKSCLVCFLGWCSPSPAQMV